MDSVPPPIPEPTAGGLFGRERWLKRLRDPRRFAAGLLLGVIGFAIARACHKPQQALTQKHYATSQDVLELYRLQIRYKTARGAYANDLDSLLSITPDAAARKARMGEHLDMSTLAVVGNAKHFKIEANVLDPERTFVSIRGPIPYYYHPGKEPTLQTMEAPPTLDGAPLAPGR